MSTQFNFSKKKTRIVQNPALNRVSCKLSKSLIFQNPALKRLVSCARVPSSPLVSAGSLPGYGPRWLWPPCPWAPWRGRWGPGGCWLWGWGRWISPAWWRRTRGAPPLPCLPSGRLLSGATSHSPSRCLHAANANNTPAKHRDIFRYKKLTLQPGFDPTTSCLSGRRTTNCATVTSLSVY